MSDRIRRTGARSRSGVVSVEAAFLFPVLIIAAMVVMELANIGLTIDMGEVALQRAVQQMRASGQPGEEGESELRRNMAEASHGYLSQADIVSVFIERFESLDALGGADEDEGQEEDGSGSGFSKIPPAWRITVDIHKDFLTPLPRLLSFVDNGFQYRFEQVLSYLPRQED
ncbi:hypothetical protein GKC30_12870 [Pseudodesulfovibrio sp. F-1]|uniref:TadE family protein n=1 Tax=Pseudodesulfovibrio alkaliphilus TaxID=2661613 RepID=A0A7K1KR05_9BACT|nr:hypothetical protein [Pseudodesulfovibrio alkaliphilus]MUM78529.1 hypothetical protein [Pseudodesulfovibrio alkaliphilus]